MYIGPEDGQNELRAAIAHPRIDSGHDMPSGTCADTGASANEGAEAVALAQAYRMLQFVRVSREMFPDLRDLADHPGWEIMLHLYVAPREKRSLTTSDLCEHTGCWRPLANRYVELLFERGIVEREVKDDKPEHWPLALSSQSDARMSELLHGFAQGWREQTLPGGG